MHTSYLFSQMASAEIDKSILFESQTGFVIRDGYLINNGHSLSIPKRYVGSFFEIRTEERQALFKLVDQAKESLGQKINPVSYSTGINDDEAVGQTKASLWRVRNYSKP